MPQSLSNIVVHWVFGTKHRSPILSGEIRERLFSYLAEVLRSCGSQPIEMGGVADHVHLLFPMPSMLGIAQVVQKVKTSSTKWIKLTWPERADFGWQSGYGAFSVRDVEGVREYIRGQEAHHRRKTFQEEYIGLLEAAGIPYDERYVWE